MRSRNVVPVLVACVLLAACGPVPDENARAGELATPSVLTDSATPSATPSVTPAATASPARPKLSAPGRTRRATPHRTHRVTRRVVPHRAVRHAPKAPGHPAGATALCRDGTFSYAAHHQGACSHHGGVLRFFS
jgi:hypothetical protein